MAALDLEEGSISCRHKRENTPEKYLFLWGEHPIAPTRFAGLGCCHGTTGMMLSNVVLVVATVIFAAEVILTWAR